MSLRGKRNLFNRRVRRRLLALSPWCAYCGQPLTFETSTVDHVTAIVWGGSDDADNLWLACSRCNYFKNCDPISCFACPRVRGGLLRYVSELPLCERTVSMSSDVIVGFNYEALDESIRERTREHAIRIHELKRSATGAVVEIGKRLIEVHEALGRGYNAWLKAEFRWSQSVASNYEGVARKFGDLKCIEQFDASALYALARGNMNERVVKESVRRAEKGEIITHEKVVKLVRKLLPNGRDQAAPAILNRTVHDLRSSVRRLDVSSVPPADCLALAEELLELVMQLRAAASAAAAIPPARKLTASKPARRAPRELAKTA